jgi:hypothetical protein
MYNSWHAMKNRCYNPVNINYENYGGRGISVCYEWQRTFDSFFRWSMTHDYKEGLEIDRIDVNGHYEPENCKWSDQVEQRYNQIIRKGQKYPNGIKWKKRAKIFQVWFCGKCIGKTKTLEEAIEIRKNAEIEKFGHSSIGVERKVVPRKYENIIKFNKTPREIKENNMKLYNIWCSIKSKNKREFFGFVCDEWWAFMDFVLWSNTNGYNIGYHLLRKDNTKPYTPDNCVFSEHTKIDTSSLYYKYKGRYHYN